MYDLRFPSIGDISYLVGWAFVAVLIGRWVFGKLDRRLAEEV